MTHPPDLPADLGDRTRIRLVALDIDGTTLTPEHRVAPATKRAVAAARKAGITVVLASSRSPNGLRPILEELDLSDEWFIAYQGALVTRWIGPAELAVLTDERLPKSVARQIEREAAEHFSVSRYTGLRWQVVELDSAIRREADITGEQPMLVSPADLDTDEAPHKLLVIAVDGAVTADLSDLVAKLPATITATYSHSNYLELTATGVDKASALASLTRYLGIPLAEVAAVGDGLNDLAMFAVVGLPIAMGQAQDEVRAAATYVTSSNSDDGVARVLTALSREPQALDHPPAED